MDTNLIEQIVRSILSDPSMQAMLGSSQSAAKQGRRALVLISNTPDIAQRLAFVSEKWGSMYELQAVLSDSAVHAGIKLPANFSLVPAEIAYQADFNFDRILVPACSKNCLAKLANGVRDTAVTELVSRAIESGIPVEMVPGYQLTPAAPAAWNAMYDAYIDRLRSFSVIVHMSIEELCTCEECMYTAPGCVLANLVPPGIKPEQITVPVPEACQTAAAAPAASAQQATAVNFGGEKKVNVFTGKVLTERDVLNWERGSVARLSKKTLITPLAKDRLLDRMIDYFTEGE